jgi:DDE_Tnp_1-associated
VTIALRGVIAGAETWEDVDEAGHAKHDWLRSFLVLPNGIPTHDTFGRVIAIDGETQRRSFGRAEAKPALHLVHAWATANNLLLGQNPRRDGVPEVPEGPRAPTPH